MATAKFLDTISKLLGKGGETSDASSAYTQVKVTELFRAQKRMSEIWIRIPPRQRPNRCHNIDDPVVPLERNFIWSPIARPSLGKNIYLKKCLYAPEARIILFLIYVEDVKMVERKQSMEKLWKFCKKEIDFEDPTPIIDQVCVGCTQREAKVDVQAVQS